MVRFSCFQTNIHCPKSKNEAQRSLESISKSLEDFSQNRVNKASGVPSISDPLKGFSDKTSSTTILEQVSCSSSPKSFCRSDEMHENPTPMANMEVHQTAYVRKSQSLGSALDEVDQVLSTNHSLEHNGSGNIYSVDHHAMIQPFDSENPEIKLHNQHEKSWVHESFQGNDERVHTELFSTLEKARQLEEGNESSSDQLSGEHADGSGHSTPGTPSMIVKSLSVPNLEFFSHTKSKEGSPSKIQGLPHSRSSEDLHALYENGEELHYHEDSFCAMEDQSRDFSVFGSIDGKCENPSVDEYEGFVNSAKEWGVSGMDEVELMKRPETSLHRLPTKDFRIKRIQEWVNMIDLDSSSPSLKDSSITYFSTDEVKKGLHVPGSTTAVKLDVKSVHGMEAAKKYISSMTATSTSAQLANLGLVVIPFLGAFVSLKVLNLSGNMIVRITAGTLPRGLHVLNLAKNNISTIEGLRELTRLRVLDLSYNRILRIGHGLASCSSLKELYLAGNKISEVEGLHRLLKLNILDLRFNKISTAKCLGQLAANYSSLQAISLEGNPAQRNVGDEQLKKYLQGLLPRLVYFNKLPIKASSSKEIVDRPGRSVTSHQSDRGLRSDHKLHRKGNLGAASTKASTSSSHAHRGQSVSSTRRMKDHHTRLPPTAAKEAHHRHHMVDVSNKLVGLPDLSMRRSQSEGNIAGA